MNRRKGLTRNESDKAPVTFQDVAACFSDEEWELLHKWQKELYKNVMTEIHQALISLGPVIATSVFSLTASEKEDVFPVDDQESDRRHSRNHSPIAPISSTHPVPITDDSQKFDHPQYTGRKKSKHLTSTEHESTILKISASIKEEVDSYPMTYQSSKKTQRQNRSSPSGFSSHVSESEVRFVDHVDGKGREVNTSSGSGFQSLITDDSYSRVEEEPTVILVDNHGTEVDKGNAGMSSAGSFIVKEEDDTFSTDLHRSKASCNIIRHTCEPVISPAFSQSVHPKNVIHLDEEPLQQEIPTGYASLNMDLEVRNSAVFSEKTTELKGLPEKATAKRTHSRSQLWTENKPGLGGDKNVQCESVFRYPLHSDTLHVTPLDETSQNYNTCEIDLRNENIVDGQPNTQQHWQPHASYDVETANTARHHLGHRYTHTAKKHHNSNECETFFSWKGPLIEHKIAQVGERLYQCTDCEKSFKHKETLIEHQRTHTGQRPYQCTDCGKSFIRKRTLIAHQRIHTGEKPYQCTGCGKSFSLKHNLNTHRKTCRHYQ